MRQIIVNFVKNSIMGTAEMVHAMSKEYKEPVIAEDSVSAARYVKKELVKLTHSLNDFPEKYSKEEYLADEPENYRSVSKWNYKIIYEVTDECLIIADIFHTGQHPSKIKRVKE